MNMMLCTFLKRQLSGEQLQSLLHEFIDLILYSAHLRKWRKKFSSVEVK